MHIGARSRNHLEASTLTYCRSTGAHDSPRGVEKDKTEASMTHMKREHTKHGKTTHTEACGESNCTAVPLIAPSTRRVVAHANGQYTPRAHTGRISNT